MENKIKLVTKEEFMSNLEFCDDYTKNYKWKNSTERKKLEENERMMRFSRLQKLNKPNNFLIDYLSKLVSENYFKKFNKIYWVDTELQDSFMFCKELLKKYQKNKV